MKPESISTLKSELQQVKPDQLVAICMRLARHKTENKELLNYLLFQSHDQEQYIEGVKNEIDAQFKNLNKTTSFLAKKTVRKVLKTTLKYVKFSDRKTTELDLLIYFCLKLKTSGLALRKGSVLGNLYLRQFERIKKVQSMLHEDLQMDYENEIAKIIDQMI
jgi:hypothetical protein